MNQVFGDVFRFVNRLADSTATFSMETWATIGVLTIVLGYLLLRGNVLRAS